MSVLHYGWNPPLLRCIQSDTQRMINIAKSWLPVTRPNFGLKTRCYHAWFVIRNSGLLEDNISYLIQGGMHFSRNKYRLSSIGQVTLGKCCIVLGKWIEQNLDYPNLRIYLINDFSQWFDRSILKEKLWFLLTSSINIHIGNYRKQELLNMNIATIF